MNSTEKRIRIAELLEWKGPFQNEWLRERGYEGEDVYDYCGTNPQGDRDSLPNWPESRDACAEFEVGLSDCEMWDYTLILAGVTIAKGYFPLLSRSETLRAMLATPAQRCDAFLRVKGEKP